MSDKKIVGPQDVKLIADPVVTKSTFQTYKEGKALRCDWSVKPPRAGRENGVTVLYSP